MYPYFEVGLKGYFYFNFHVRIQIKTQWKQGTRMNIDLCDIIGQPISIIIAHMPTLFLLI